MAAMLVHGGWSSGAEMSVSRTDIMYPSSGSSALRSAEFCTSRIRTRTRRSSVNGVPRVYQTSSKFAARKCGRVSAGIKHVTKGVVAMAGRKRLDVAQQTPSIDEVLPERGDTCQMEKEKTIEESTSEGLVDTHGRQLQEWILPSSFFGASLLACTVLFSDLTSFAMATEADGVSNAGLSYSGMLFSFHEFLQRVDLPLAELDPNSSKFIITILGPFFSVFNLLFIFRIIMSWYPQISVSKFPFIIAYAPTEPILGPTRRLIPPVGGVDVSPVIWVALTSFLNEILLGKQGLFVLLSQQQP